MKRRVASILWFIVVGAFFVNAQAQSGSAKLKKDLPNLARLAGRYDVGGLTIQFAQENGKLTLIVPGAPIQHLEYVGNNRFKSSVFKDQYFRFVEEGKEITEVITEGNGTSSGKKIGNDVVVLSKVMDSLLLSRKSTDHFLFLYAARDAATIDSLAMDMERNYKRILQDLQVNNIPKVSVRVYPDLESFHKGINFPNAPDQVLATAFGKDDVRMVSPHNAGPERWMLEYAAPHEFTHVVHLNISYAPNNPRWLWEGVAQYEAKWFFDPAELDFIQKKEFPALADLGNGMEYMLGFAVIEAIKEIWGFETVIRLIKANGDVQTTLGMSQEVFDAKIFHHIHQKYVKQ